LGVSKNVISFRIPREYDWLIEKMGTFFELPAAQVLEEIQDPMEIQRLSGKMVRTQSLL
jgi:hypothetical protein